MESHRHEEEVENHSTPALISSPLTDTVSSSSMEQACPVHAPVPSLDRRAVATTWWAGWIKCTDPADTRSDRPGPKEEMGVEPVVSRSSRVSRFSRL